MPTKKRKLKRRIRERMDRTGESYTAARMHILNSGRSWSVKISAPQPERKTQAPQALAALLASAGPLVSTKRLQEQLAASLGPLLNPPDLMGGVLSDLRAQVRKQQEQMLRSLEALIYPHKQLEDWLQRETEKFLPVIRDFEEQMQRLQRPAKEMVEKMERDAQAVIDRFMISRAG